MKIEILDEAEKDLVDGLGKQRGQVSTFDISGLL